MLGLGRLAAGFALTALDRGAREILRGRIPDASDLLLQPANAERLSRQLAQMRGAVMKVGQLLSMEAGEFLPPELTGILNGLRDQAHAMPDRDLREMLTGAWGEGWPDRFKSFQIQPIAAASIGQVHTAIDLEGRKLAIKVQYPGIADSIDSDIDNLGRLLGWLRVLPEDMNVNPLLEMAREQLKQEADYLLEARHLQCYRQRLGNDSVFRVPEVIEEMSGSQVLTMTFMDGVGIESLADLSPVRRNRLAARMIELMLREFLDWGLLQSDPNFANYLFDARNDRIGLLDFGATRVHSPERAQTLAQLLLATLDQDYGAIVDAAIRVGYLTQEDDFNDRMALVDLVLTATEPALHRGDFHFGSADLATRLAQKLYALRERRAFQRPPPADLVFLHRKLGGMYLLCARINAAVDVGAVINHVLRPRSVQLAG